MKNVREITLNQSQIQKKKRVAAYARVSCGKDTMLHSLKTQIDYYRDLINHHPEWAFAGIYADEAKTGTKDNREQFQMLLTDCRAGKIDMVITKAISRFARNTVTLLETVRELKCLCVDVYFEEQNIHTISTDGELLLTLLASYAQEESRSVSENQKWRVRRNFENGQPWNGTLLGYRIKDGQYVVVEKEAETVRRIYDEFLNGYGCESIAQHLNEDEAPTRVGNFWYCSSIQKILRNYSYTGNLLLQSTYNENYITKKKKTNKGEKAKYLATETHEPIISAETFEKVQDELAQRAEKYRSAHLQKSYPFSRKLICAGCGKYYTRRKTSVGYAWICSTFKIYGKSACPTAKQIPESCLEQASAQALGIKVFDAKRFEDAVSFIKVSPNNMLEFFLKDGSRKAVEWKDHSRADSWTKEMREKARKNELERSRLNG